MPVLQQAGRFQQTSEINRFIKLESSIYAWADNLTTTAFNSILNEVQRRQDTKRKVLTLIARSLDNIVVSY